MIIVRRIALGVVLALSISTVYAQGIVLPGAGPINRSMAGASTALPVDFGGSYWNPAIISGLDRSELLIGSELIIPSTHLQTTLRANSINGQFPPTNRVGLARSDSGVVPNVAVGTSFRLRDDSPMTFGIGIFGFIGGGVNYAGSLTQPVLAPRQPPNFFGVGPIFSNSSVLTINPTGSYQASDKLAIAFGPIISTTVASFSPAFFAPGPVDASGLPTFPAATNGRTFWGAGFQLGLFYELNDDWNLGFSYKSPIWQERWNWNSSNPNLSDRRIGLQADYPAIYSWGVAYKGFDRAAIDVDFRYFDYANTGLYGQKVVDGGLGWDSVFAVATGGYYQLTDRLTLRGGYLYNTNPINGAETLFNVQAPGNIQHTLSLGSSFYVTENIVLSAAWVHGFRAFNEGPIGQIPGSTAQFDTQIDSIVVGLNIKFGGSRKAASAGPALPALPPPPNL